MGEKGFKRAAMVKNGQLIGMLTEEAAKKALKGQTFRSIKHLFSQLEFNSKPTVIKCSSRSFDLNQGSLFRQATRYRACGFLRRFRF